jgi:hypothetical protein
MTNIAVTPTVHEALAYAAAGWAVYPVRPRTKRPLNPHGSAEATNDEAIVHQWWRRWPWANVGGVVPPGLVVVDLDPRNGAQLDWVERWPRTLTVATGGGGVHLYWQAPAVVLTATSAEWPGLDVLRAGHGVMLPPSLHPSGARYHWVTDVEPGRLPAELLLALRRPRRPGSHTRWSGHSNGVCWSLDRRLAELAASSPGQRNVRANAAAFHAGLLVGRGELHEDDAVERLADAAAACGLPPAEADYVIRRGIADGIAEPVELTRRRRGIRT